MVVVRATEQQKIPYPLFTNLRCVPSKGPDPELGKHPLIRCRLPESAAAAPDVDAREMGRSVQGDPRTARGAGRDACCL
jgi:hypothetical protein